MNHCDDNGLNLKILLSYFLLELKSPKGDKNIIKFDGDHNSPRPQFYFDSINIFFHNVLQPPEDEVGESFFDPMNDYFGKDVWRSVHELGYSNESLSKNKGMTQVPKPSTSSTINAIEQVRSRRPMSRMEVPSDISSKDEHREHEEKCGNISPSSSSMISFELSNGDPFGSHVPATLEDDQYVEYQLDDLAEKDEQRMETIPKLLEHEIDMSSLYVFSMPSPPPPPPPLPVERVIVEPTLFHKEANINPPKKSPVPPTFAKTFTIASLQQCTNSFSQDNLIGLGMLGSVYRAELPDGKILAVKKLDKRVSDHQTDDEFLELINSIDRIRHPNIAELIGYCAEHGQRLLIYEYCINGSLEDALHSDDEFKTRLSWNSRYK
ncbi:hypothetical protein JHK85_010320 [Glycine max]|nr:hypothetical protein JHK85_010320 [Glycine max]KAG5066312.1 hypothetical protein JHK86_010043 [Glycine max]